MSLKLIRKAQIATTTNKDILVAEHVRQVLRQELGTDIDELDLLPKLGLKAVSETAGMEITKDDYAQWMNVVHDVAQQSGMTLTKKSQLADIAMSILDNDPKIDAQPGDKEQLKSHIIDTMWNAHKATLGHARVSSSVKKAREEEEMSGFGQAFRTAQGVEDEQQSSSLLKGALGNSDQNPYPPGSLKAALWNKVHTQSSAKAITATCYDEEEFRPEDQPSDDDMEDPDAMSDDLSDDAPEQMDDDMSAGDAPAGADEVPDEDPEDDTNSEEDPDDLLASLSTDELEAELARRQGEDSDDEVDADADVDADPEMDDADVDADPEAASPEQVDGDGDDDTVDKIASRITSEDEEFNSKKDPIQHVISRPTDDLRQALADVEDTGLKAALGIKFDKNPHPPKSHAWKAHNKGFLKGVKTLFGIKDPAPASTSKQKKRR